MQPDEPRCPHLLQRIPADVVYGQLQQLRIPLVNGNVPLVYVFSLFRLAGIMLVSLRKVLFDEAEHALYRKDVE